MDCIDLHFGAFIIYYLSIKNYATENDEVFFYSEYKIGYLLASHYRFTPI